MVLRINSGYSPDYLLKEVATGRESYYTGAVVEGEPPGRWWGAGAEKLGLRGLVDAQDMRAVYERFLDPRAEGFREPERWDEVTTLGHAGRKYMSEDELYARALEREPHASAERRAELRTEAGLNARHNVAFFDLTFSVQKSVTLLHTAFEAQQVTARRTGDEQTAAAWGEFRQAVEDAIWAGNNAALAYLQDKAGYTRTGHHGGAAGRWADAHEWTVGSFFQHDSREHDPQLHIHNALLNRVQDPDGNWLTLDGRSLFRWRPAAAAIAERVTEERLTRALGVLFAMRPDGKAREIVGIDQTAMDLVSTRRRQVTGKAAELINDFVARHDREPTSLERERIAQQATLATRRAKSHTGQTREQLLDRVEATLRADLDQGLAGVALGALDARSTGGVTAAAWSPTAVLETALADVQSRKAGWTRADLTSAINAALPDNLGLDEGEVPELLDRLTDKGIELATTLDTARPGDTHLPAELRLANGESSYVAPGSQLFATPEHVRTERALITAARPGSGTAMPKAIAAGFVERLRREGVRLGADQAAAIEGVLTSGAAREVLIGPAGTGKSFVVGMIARAWTDPTLTGSPARRVFGLATSQAATNVLASEGLTARNAAAWLAAQHRLTAGTTTGTPRPEDAELALRAGDIVVVDESAMTDSDTLSAIAAHVDKVGAKLLPVGDHRQLGAVGAGGGMDLIATAGPTYELTDVRRFTNDWEGPASLRLREGDQTVLADYHRHGRFRDAGTLTTAAQQAARAWLGDSLAGHESLLVVDTNDQAAELSATIRADLVRLGLVEEHGVPLGLQGTTAGVGDLVEARSLDWTLIGYQGNTRAPITRETYRVLAIRDNGDIEVVPARGLANPSHDAGAEAGGEPMVLPAAYVGKHLALAYASTVHSAQGRTVDTTHTLTTANTRANAFYVAMSRGRHANTAHVVTRSQVDDPARGDHRHDLHRDPLAVVTAVTEPDPDLVHASAVATATRAAAEAGSVATAGEMLADAAHLAATQRTVAWLDQLTADGTLTPQQRARIAAEDGAPSLARVLRRAELAGHDPHQILIDAVHERPLTGASNTTNVLHSRITHGNTRRFDPVGTTWTEWTPRVDDPEWDNYLTALASAADARAAQLGRATAEAAPAWAITALGPVPDDRDERVDWEAKAAIVAAYRELRGHDDDADALGAAPPPGQVESYAAYRAGWQALGRPEIDRAFHEMSDGQLRVRVRAAEREAAWLPRYVANELAGTHQAAAQHRQTAAVRRTEAAANPDAAEALHQEAADLDALADVLDARCDDLQKIDDARAKVLAHTAVTRANADAARFLLAERHADDQEPEPTVTAQEWLDAERAARRDDDDHRPITDTDLHTGDELPDDHTAAATTETRPLTPAPTDVREVAAAEPQPVAEDDVRVPTAEDVNHSLDRAQRALDEITARELLDADEDDHHSALGTADTADGVDDADAPVMAQDVT